MISLEELQILENRHDGINHITDTGECIFKYDSRDFGFVFLMRGKIYRDSSTK